MKSEFEVLFIDDSQRTLDMLSKMMTKTGISGLYTKDPKQAIEFIETFDSINIVFIDIMMPSICGLSLLDIMKKRFDGRDLKYCFLSGVNSAEKVKKALSMGVEDYVIKPFDMEFLIDRINKARGIEVKSSTGKYYYCKNTDLNVELVDTPFTLNMCLVFVNEKGGLIELPFSLSQITDILKFKSEELGKFVHVNNDIFHAIVDSFEIDGVKTKAYFRFVDLSESQLKQLRSFCINEKDLKQAS